ncbi:MAG TPA: hypothetical protein VI413_10795 [Paludibacter sp.]
MITNEDGLRKQTASDGMLLVNGESFTKEVYLGNGMPELEEVPDDGKLEPIPAEVIE